MTRPVREPLGRDDDADSVFLGALGIEFHKPKGSLKIRDGGRLDIGCVYLADDGSTHGFPRVGLDEDTYARFVSATTDCAIRGRRSTVWRRVDDTGYDGWLATILIRMPGERQATARASEVAR
ncbi:hypothetical protein [Nocardia sp. CA-119907]|uniref:hypothetical protein n=1 Tax=Nocardia sp. CA-119907 TaxID=3239973 RepID=UPI003D98CFBE